MEDIPEYSVSALSAEIKRAVEERFGTVRVRGELGRVTRAASGHVYLDLKDDRAVIAGVVWKGAASRLSVIPEQGMEVVATGRMSAFPGQSRYQLVIESLVLAGAGAMMALFEARRKKFAALGLFDAERKKPLPYFPSVIGVVTSPSGAVIRDILHRLRARCPVRVIVWPSVVQGKGAEEKIAAAVDGFNALKAGTCVPRPDVIIVARGGGSLEDLWCFNEEAVVQAVAASTIPVISAVGHETDTTLVDFVSDKRAPTPSAAAEMAVPVRSELLGEVRNKERRLIGAAGQVVRICRTGLVAASRGLGSPVDYLGMTVQRFDRAVSGLGTGLRIRLDSSSALLSRTGGRFHRNLLSCVLVSGKGRIQSAWSRIAGCMDRKTDGCAVRLVSFGRLLESVSFQSILGRGFALVRRRNGALVRRAADVPGSGRGRLQFADGICSVTFGDLPADTAPGRSSGDRVKGDFSTGRGRKPVREIKKGSFQHGLFDDP